MLQGYENGGKYALHHDRFRRMLLGPSVQRALMLGERRYHEGTCRPSYLAH